MSRQFIYAGVALTCIAALYSEYFNQPPGPSWEERHGQENAAPASEGVESMLQGHTETGTSTETAASEGPSEPSQTSDSESYEEGLLAQFMEGELRAHLATPGEPLFDLLLAQWDGESGVIAHPDYDLIVFREEQDVSGIGVTLKPALETGEPLDGSFLSRAMEDARAIDDGSGADRELELLNMAGEVQLNELTCIASRCTFSMAHSEQSQNLIARLNELDTLALNVFYGSGDLPVAVVDLRFNDAPEQVTAR